jgi:hypothetical protein
MYVYLNKGIEETSIIGRHIETIQQKIYLKMYLNAKYDSTVIELTFDRICCIDTCRGICFHFLLILCFSYNLFLSFLLLSLSSTGLSQAQSGGVAARLKLTRNMTVSSNPSSNLPPSFTWPNKSKCMMVLSSTLTVLIVCVV